MKMTALWRFIEFWGSHGLLRKDKGSNEPKQDLLVILLPHQELDEGFTSYTKEPEWFDQTMSVQGLGLLSFFEHVSMRMNVYMQSIMTKWNDFVICGKRTKPLAPSAGATPN